MQKQCIHYKPFSPMPVRGFLAGYGSLLSLSGNHFALGCGRGKPIHRVIFNLGALLHFHRIKCRHRDPDPSIH